MFAGIDSPNWEGFWPFMVAMSIVALAWWRVSPFTIAHARLVQKAGEFTIGWFKGLLEWGSPSSQLEEKDISPFFWPNGTMPNSAEYNDLVADNFPPFISLGIEE